MRFLLKARMSVEAGNKVAREGRLGEVIGSIVDHMKPEAVYFLADNGERTAYIFFEMKDASQIPNIAEPWFLALNAHLELHPVMVPADLKKADPDIAAAVKKFG